MTSGVRVLGVGQPSAGDDGIGFLIVDRLRAWADEFDLELHAITDTSALIGLLETSMPIVIIDAVIGGSDVGTVITRGPDAFQSEPYTPMSTHGLGVMDAIAVARAIAPTGVSQAITIVGVVIARPSHRGVGLSAEVAAAVPRAVSTVLDVARSLG